MWCTTTDLWVEMQLAKLQQEGLEGCATRLRTTLDDPALPAASRAALAVAVRKAGADLAKFCWASGQYAEVPQTGLWVVRQAGAPREKRREPFEECVLAKAA